jgi:hypothetical protein
MGAAHVLALDYLFLGSCGGSEFLASPTSQQDRPSHPDGPE